MMNELIVRFLLGGAIVSIVACIAEMFEPKTFAGLFGAAPSVALATLMLAYSKHGPSYVAIEGRSMVAGAFALLSYSCACVAGSKNERLPQHDGRSKAVDDARGARLGSLALAAFGLTVWLTAEVWPAAIVLVAALVVWTIAGTGAWWAQYGKSA